MPTLHVYWSDRHDRAEQEQLQAAVAEVMGGPQEIVIWYHWFRVSDVYVDGIRLDRMGADTSAGSPSDTVTQQ